MKRRQRRDSHGRFVAASRRNPFFEEIVIKPMATAAMAHLGTETAKAGLKRLRRARGKRKRK